MNLVMLEKDTSQHLSSNSSTLFLWQPKTQGLHRLSLFLFFLLNFRLTVFTVRNLSDDMWIADINGRPHPLTQYHVQMILVIGWITFLLSWMLNIMYYRVHPSAVDKNLKTKLFIWILGKRVELPGYHNEDYGYQPHKNGLVFREITHPLHSIINHH